MKITTFEIKIFLNKEFDVLSQNQPKTSICWFDDISSYEMVTSILIKGDFDDFVTAMTFCRNSYQRRIWCVLSIYLWECMGVDMCLDIIK